MYTNGQGYQNASIFQIWARWLSRILLTYACVNYYISQYVNSFMAQKCALAEK